MLSPSAFPQYSRLLRAVLKDGRHEEELVLEEAANNLRSTQMQPSLSLRVVICEDDGSKDEDAGE